MSSGQSLRNGNSVEPGLPNTFLMPNARNRPKVASLTVIEALALFAGLRDKGMTSARHCERSEAIHSSGALGMDCCVASLLAMTVYHVAVPFIVGWPAELAVHNSMPVALSLALIENSLPSN